MDINPPTPLCLEITRHIDERFGGIASSLPRFSQAITDTGRFRSRLVALCGETETVPAHLSADAVHRLPAGRLRWAVNASLNRNLESLISSSAIVHIHGLWDEHSVTASRLCRALCKPYIVSAHGMLEPWALNNRKRKKQAYLSLIEGRVLRGAAGLRALTRAECTDYRNLALNNPITILPNGVDLPAEASPAQFLAAFPHLHGLRLILFLGRIHPKKNVDLLCRAWAKLHESFPLAHLVVSGPEEDKTPGVLARLVRDLGIEDRVTITGMLRGPMKWAALSAASCFVLPSHSEGFSIAILEALGSGLPVIVSRPCHFPEVVNAGCGWEIEPVEDQLTERLSCMLSLSTDCIAEMGRKGRELVARDYTWSRIGERAATMLGQWSGND
jgi:glycosyltransferase involved in cell wall biosynthesis